MGSTNDVTMIGAGQAGLTRDLARDLFPGATTPFARTLLAAPAERALRSAYAELGGQAPDARFWRFEGGYGYLDAAAIAEADQSLCGAGWLGARQPAAPGGLRGRLQSGGVIRRCQAHQAAAIGEATGLQTRLSRWWAWVQGLKWTQADLLQVMEELEPHALSALQTYFLVRTALNAAAATFDGRLKEWLPDLSPELAAGLALAAPGLPSIATVETVLRCTSLPASDPDRLQALAGVSHRGPGEIRPDAIRWPDALALLSPLVEQQEPRWPPDKAVAGRLASRQRVEHKLNSGQLRQLNELLEALFATVRAADVAWDSLTLVMAAAQRWAAAAARETLAARLISKPSDVLYLELEELKQVATGEWHAGDREEVLAAVERRLRAAAEPPASSPPAPPIVVSPGVSEGSLYEGRPQDAPPPPGAVWIDETADPGCAPFWVFAGSIQTTGRDPWSPGMIAARGLGLPARAGV